MTGAAMIVANDGRAKSIAVNTNGISDIWKTIHKAAALDPNADADGDGFSNGQEALAGTDPFDSDSYPRISTVTCSNGTFNVSFPCALGKRYQLQSVQLLGSTNWVNETDVVARASSMVTLAVPANLQTKYFRIAISDTNTDGGGLSDWEKYQLGLDPFNPTSNGKLDASGNPMSDDTFASAQLESENIITVAATDPTAIEPDPGQPATAAGQFTITRGGFPLDAITVNFGFGNPGTGKAKAGVDYAVPATSVTLAAGISSQTVTVTPIANTNLVTPALVQLQLLPGANYTIGDESNASVVIYPSTTPKGTGLLGQYFTNSSWTYTNSLNFNPTNLFLTRTDPMIDFNWTNGISPNLSNGLYSVRWTGQMQPQFSEAYFLDVKSDDGCRLWVNDQLLIDKWSTQGATEWTNAIALQADVHYDLKLEYLQAGGTAQAHLYWYSASQAKQIIPNTRLYPTSSFGGGSLNAPAVITSALSAVAFLGQPFSFTVTGANTPFGFTADGLPPGLSFNNANGVIAGIPTLAGDYQVTLTASNLVGGGASVVDILVLDTGSSVVQEIWTSVNGSYVTNIPTGKPANLTNTLGSLEGVTDYGGNYGQRVRGFLTAPATGYYYFWIAASDSAELWISNDGDPVNKVLRAWVTPTNNPTASGRKGTSPHQWNLQAKQRSGWLALTAGQKYYIEILQKAATGVRDNWSVAWLLDPTGTNSTPAGVVPGYVLSRYYPPLPVTIPGTLYSANLLALPGVASVGTGTATLRLSADETEAILNFQANNLVGAVTAEHIDADPYLSHPGQPELFDISVARPQSDGSYVWKIKGVGTLSAADVVEIIKEGKAFLTIETSVFSGGELSGHFTLANGTQTFAPPPAPPAWKDDHSNTNAAARFLNQATFGASSSDIASVRSLGYSNWINKQISLPVTHHLPLVMTGANPTFAFPSALWFNTWWQQSVTAPDQLRQRVAFALSEIMVVSENGTLQNSANCLAHYYDTLLNNSFGNFRTLLKSVSLTPAMGAYLNMKGNDKGSIITGLHANENYAREINQLFSVGLNRLWPDGSLILNAQGNLVPTYNQNVVMGFAAAFTGWNYYQTNQANGHLPSNWYPGLNLTNPMVLVPTHHDLDAKLVLDNVVLPPAWGNQSVSTNAAFDAYCSHDLDAALDSIFYNQNVGPFICRELIQLLVNCNPSREYVYRVVKKFNDNGHGVRGDMSAVIKAILLDYEARSTNMLAAPGYGKQREPLLRVTATARALPAPPALKGIYAENGAAMITNKTSVPHRLNNNDTVLLTFTDTSGSPAPPAQRYTVTVDSPKIFRVTLPGMVSGTYGQTNGILSLAVAGHGLAAGNQVYLLFTSGNSSNGVYQVAAVPNSDHFTVSTGDLATKSGNCLIPKLTGGGFMVQNNTNVTVFTTQPHGLKSGNPVYLSFANAGGPASGRYAIASVPNPARFTVTVPGVNNQSINGLTVYPLVAPRISGHGNVQIQWNTWNLGYTDIGSSTTWSQSPLRSPTVFKFYFPDYHFPGVLASAGLTTPEFQLTSDTSVALQMNFIGSGILNNTGNTNGLSSYTGGDGDIFLDIHPWMTTNYTAAAGIPRLVDAFNTRLLAGQLSAAAKTTIVNYVTNTVNFPYTTPVPTAAQMRDRVRAVVHLLITSPDYTIQK